ncbi:MAG: Druantia anti-phage system protein DruA, partial [Candidatus Binatia bacterium]
AWTMAARDRWIGWTAVQRAQNLQFIVNNSRFLILPWVKVNNLASAILARSARQLPNDWSEHYGYTPLLLETLVNVTRFNGTCYRAANWIALGQTTGRGRMDKHHTAQGTQKQIFVFPLHRRVQQRLCATVPTNVSLSNAE